MICRGPPEESAIKEKLLTWETWSLGQSLSLKFGKLFCVDGLRSLFIILEISTGCPLNAFLELNVEEEKLWSIFHLGVELGRKLCLFVNSFSLTGTFRIAEGQPYPPSNKGYCRGRPCPDLVGHTDVPKRCHLIFLTAIHSTKCTTWFSYLFKSYQQTKWPSNYSVPNSKQDVVLGIVIISSLFLCVSSLKGSNTFSPTECQSHRWALE